LGVILLLKESAILPSGERKNIGRHCLSRLASQKTGISKDSCPTTDVEQPDYCNLDFLERPNVYHLLQDCIFKWDFLYGEVPAPSSLTWFVYPDGQFWRDRVQIYGSKAFAAMAVAMDNFHDMWSGRLKATSKNISDVRVSLVLSYCFGDLSWLKSYHQWFCFRSYFCRSQMRKSTRPRCTSRKFHVDASS